MKIKNEMLFLRFYDGSHGIVSPSDSGRIQFFKDQSYGEKTTIPDIFYLQLTHGKSLFDWQCSELKKAYFDIKGECIMWPGLLQICRDWKKDRWVLKHLLAWHPKKTRFLRYKTPKLLGKVKC